MELESIVAVIAVVISALSVALAGLANRRAREALDLQSRIDRRAREFRDVIWHGDLVPDPDRSPPWSFHLTNNGLTEAVEVALVIEWSQPQLVHLGALKPGETRLTPAPNAAAWFEEHRQTMPNHPGFRVHWSSPLGEVNEIHVPPVQLFT